LFNWFGRPFSPKELRTVKMKNPLNGLNSLHEGRGSFSQIGHGLPFLFAVWRPYRPIPRRLTVCLIYPGANGNHRHVDRGFNVNYALNEVFGAACGSASKGAVLGRMLGKLLLIFAMLLAGCATNRESATSPLFSPTGPYQDAAGILPTGSYVVGQL
jgi:hypothetical protein